ncbi:hypothetical protein FNZ56_06365 [Pseudoluteimonas lycopersici]|uniref:Uncharacterized protein n=1 Tax=Pseudoluteimonas lycopersici TaxID=1324796 RepID=A0A516V4P5_9GAMM|nr:hypothetical protein [Lysobacter lycopersici]QDQ73520.1 hypothetical protein FNZ56_06365 [Lysobacter lycopersici]
MGISQPAQAVTQNRLIAALGADTCKLSVPTTDSKVRPRATGFRNEGTTNVFVICTIHTDNGPGGSFGSAPFIDAGLAALSLDGAGHDVQCTGVNSFSVLGDQQYVTKIQNTGTNLTQFWWIEDDFGVSDGSGIPGTGAFSITCILPPNVSLDLVLANMSEDVGS